MGVRRGERTEAIASGEGWWRRGDPDEVCWGSDSLSHDAVPGFRRVTCLNYFEERLCLSLEVPGVVVSAPHSRRRQETPRMFERAKSNDDLQWEAPRVGDPRP